jgi:virginiamycin B lyase
MAHWEGGLGLTDHDDDARPQRSARLRAGLLAAAVATALLPVIYAGSPAGASPAPGRAAAAGGYLYWSNTIGSITKPGDGVIVRARLNGTDVNQNFITGASLPDGITAAGGYLYWTNHTGTIGRARLNGTDVNQNFIKTAQPNGPDAVVAGSGHLYWANDFNIGRANLNGTKVDQKFITGASFPDAIAAGSRYLYWTNAALGGNPNRRAIGRPGSTAPMSTSASSPERTSSTSKVWQ